MEKGEAISLRAEIVEELGKAKISNSNLTPEEWRAMKKLKDDEDILVLPADKGKCLVVMDKEEYIRKMEEKLSDQTTYKLIEKDPTEEIKTAISNQLNKIKDEGQIDNKTFFRLFPTKTRIPRMYGQPKIHKENYPLREIVDSTSSVAKECDKYIGKVIQKYTGKSPYYVKDSAHFAEMIKDLTVDEDEILVSYDVTALYPSVPQEEAIEIIYQIMKDDPNLSEKTSMSAENLIQLFKICVRTTYFVFNRKLYQQVDGLAIGASSSGPAAELFMEKLEIRAITTFIDPPKLWKRYVDDTFAKLKIIMVEAFLEHLNRQHPRIKFTTEIQKDGKISFLATLVHVLPDRSTKITIYRKATHTDQYLDFQSNHHLKQKIGIISTFKHSIEKLVTEEEDKNKEIKHVKKALKRCGHPKWSLNRKQRVGPKEEKTERRGKIVLPYVKGVSEGLARIYKRYDIETIHKPSSTLKNLLCNRMKDKVEVLDKTGAVYHTECIKKECREEREKDDYVGETERVTRERMYEHRVIDHKTSKQYASLRDPKDTNKPGPAPKTLRRSARNKQKKDYKAIQEGSNQLLSEGSTDFSAHVASNTHEKSDLSFSVLCTEENWFKRGVKEAVAIRKIRPSLNKDLGRHHLSSIYDKFIRSSVTMKTTRNGAKEASEGTDF